MIVRSEVGGDILRDKVGGPFRALPNKHLKPSNAFKDYGWFLTRDDKHVVLNISTYPWMGTKVWSFKAWSEGLIVQKIDTPAYCEPKTFTLEHRSPVVSLRFTCTCSHS